MYWKVSARTIQKRKKQQMEEIKDSNIDLIGWYKRITLMLQSGGMHHEKDQNTVNSGLKTDKSHKNTIEVSQYMNRFLGDTKLNSTHK